uniref:Putative neurotoxin LTDF 02-21 n=1 Tax=Dolomedes fimbriatus TaxID=1432569 RepID=A0A0K1D882_9ARAC|nr:putative neurotoxin LTDF 02-21 [Dolomedes fimbriatus]
MKTLLLFISVPYLAHSFTLEEEKEALELSEETAVQDAEPLQAEDAVEERQRKCIANGNSCKSDCDCCYGAYDHCSCWLWSCSCVTGAANDCFNKKSKCNMPNLKCVTRGQNPRNRG